MATRKSGIKSKFDIEKRLTNAMPNGLTADQIRQINESFNERIGMAITEKLAMGMDIDKYPYEDILEHIGREKIMQWLLNNDQ